MQKKGLSNARDHPRIQQTLKIGKQSIPEETAAGKTLRLRCERDSGRCNHNNVGCNIITACMMLLNNTGKHQRFRSSGSNMHQQQQRQQDLQRKQKQTTCTQRTKTTYTRAKNQTTCIRTLNQIASQSTQRTNQHAGTRTEPSSANTRT